MGAWGKITGNMSIDVGNSPSSHDQSLQIVSSCKLRYPNNVNPILQFVLKAAIVLLGAFFFVFTALGRYIVWAFGVFLLFSLVASLTRKWWQPIVDRRKARDKNDRTENKQQE